MKEKKQDLIAKLILNTKRHDRISNIVEIAEDIEELSKQVGGLEQVSQIIGISKHMLNQFLSVNRLSDAVKRKLVNRELDSVSVVNYIAKYNPEEQEYLANKYIEGELNSQDIRAIGPLKSKYKEVPIEDLASKVTRSKNIKVSVIYIPLSEKVEINQAEKILTKLVGEENIISIEAKGYLGIVKLTKEGEEILKTQSKNQSLKKYLEEILKI